MSIQVDGEHQYIDAIVAALKLARQEDAELGVIMSLQAAWKSALVDTVLDPMTKPEGVKNARF